jgi:hypothetical protein
VKFKKPKFTKFACPTEISDTQIHKICLSASNFRFLSSQNFPVWPNFQIITKLAVPIDISDTQTQKICRYSQNFRCPNLQYNQVWTKLEITSKFSILDTQLHISFPKVFERDAITVNDVLNAYNVYNNAYNMNSSKNA